MQNRAPLPMAKELTLALSHFQASAPLAESLPPLQTANSALLLRQLYEASMTSATTASTHRNQSMSSQLQSDSPERIALRLQQREPLNQAQGSVAFGPMQMRSLDPVFINQLPSLAETILQNQVLGYQLNCDTNQSRRNAMSLLPNALGGLITGMLSGDDNDVWKI